MLFCLLAWNGMLLGPLFRILAKKLPSHIAVCRIAEVGMFCFVVRSLFILVWFSNQTLRSVIK